MRGGLGHRRNDQQRIVHRHLHGLTQRGVHVSTVDVVHPDHVRQEQAVELAALEQASEFHPVVQALVVRRAVQRVAPHALGLMAHAVHRERVQE